MERKIVKLPKDASEIAFTGDVHNGHGGLVEEAFDSALKRMIDRGQYTVLMGDLIEARPPSHKFYEVGSPTVQEQKKWIIKKLKPLADAGLILGILNGNHENSIKQFSSLDPIEDICDQLGATNLGDSAFLGIKHKTNLYKLIVAHGGGGATTLTGTITKLKNYANNHAVDAVVWGHTHQLLHVPTLYMEYDNEGNQIEKLRKIAFAGTFLKTYTYGKSSYAERKGYGMTSIGYLYAEMDKGKLRWSEYDY